MSKDRAVSLILEMGQCVALSNHATRTAIVILRQFLQHHALGDFPFKSLCVACLFLAAKYVEEKRPLKHILKETAHLFRNGPRISFDCTKQLKKVFLIEELLLSTLGFMIEDHHPNEYVVKICKMVKAGKELSTLAYRFADYSIYRSDICLSYKPVKIACGCFHLACVSNDWKIPLSDEGKEWFMYFDGSLTVENLNDLALELASVVGETLKIKKEMKDSPSSLATAMVESPKKRKDSSDKENTPPGAEKRKITLADYKKRADVAPMVLKLPAFAKEFFARESRKRSG